MGYLHCRQTLHLSTTISATVAEKTVDMVKVLGPLHPWKEFLALN